MEKRYTRSEVKELMEKLLFDAGRNVHDGIDEWFNNNVPPQEVLDLSERLDKFEERLRRLEPDKDNP